MFPSLVRGVSRGSRITKSSRQPQGDLDDTMDSPRRHRISPYPSDDEEQDEEDDSPDAVDEDELEEDDPLLPLFSSAHLDSIPIYSLTHILRQLIVKKCETTLSWDQLRSPQISQFLIKPVQNTIRESHLNRATLYVLLANCLQFKKEGQMKPGIVGICNTRAMIAELLAMRLLKDYTTRELIDAVSYDFDPMSGMPQPTISFQGVTPRRRIALARSSTIEVAIRAEAKKFIAHPLVVQHLEAIWAGSIVFHSAADRLHRYPMRPPVNHIRHYGATHDSRGLAPLDGGGSGEVDQSRAPRRVSEAIRRSVTLYDPSNASLFKLSRLRVPRYRQIFSTLSYAVLLCLFLAVLSNRSNDLTTLEIIFWLWSIGFMLDELVGFSEQGFGLYIASVWNVFDIGILALLGVYYALRVGSVLMPGPDSDYLASMAYDVLASTAVLLFPRLFNMLDHYRYFSQLLIAFRLMAQDLAAVMILIAIACSGFFVAFTFSFGQEDFDGRGVAYALFQLIMGFTPAAWDVWSDFNPLGQVLLALFLLMCHFLVVTILVSVLTNSFMAIVKNANEEHQFLFAVNVISMVKSDMLFSFIAPTNLAGWIIAPLRYCIPFHQYVMLNRTLIKATHFPILFAIFGYERLSLVLYSYEPVEHVERRGRSLRRMPTFALGQDAYGTHLRNPSAATYQDQALAEVFRRPYEDGSTTRKRQPSNERRATVVDQWMSGLGTVGTPPTGDVGLATPNTGRRFRSRTARSIASGERPSNKTSRARTHASDPEEDFRRTASEPRASEDSDLMDFSMDDDKPEDGLEDTKDEATRGESFSGEEEGLVSATIKFREPVGPSSVGSTVRARVMSTTPSKFLDSSPGVAARISDGHSRQASTNTIVFKPVSPQTQSSSASSRRSSRQPPRRGSTRPTVQASDSLLSLQETGAVGGPYTRRNPERPPMPGRQGPANKSASNLESLLKVQQQGRGRGMRRPPSVDTVALDLASDIGDNRHIDNFGPGSFQTQMHYGFEAMRRNSREDEGAVGRMVLARMNTIEEGFKDILKEVKQLKNPAPTPTTGSPSKHAARLRGPTWAPAGVTARPGKPASGSTTAAVATVGTAAGRSGDGVEVGHGDEGGAGGGERSDSDVAAPVG